MAVTLPYTLTNGQPNDATEVMANFNAIVAEVNGGLDLTNMDSSVGNSFLRLLTSANRKAAFGTFATSAFDAAANMSRATGTFAHGLGSSPVIVLGTCGSIADSAHAGAENAPTFAPVSWDATNVSYVCTLGGGTSNNSTDVYWFAIA